MDETKTLSESQSAEAVNAAAVHAEAIEKARAAQFMAVLEEFFNRGVDEKKFVDVGRIPFICDDIRGMHEILTQVSVTVWWLKWLCMGVVGGIGLIIVGVTTAIVTKFI